MLTTMSSDVRSERENTERHLSDLKKEGTISNLDVNYDIQSTLLATKKALDEDLKVSVLN